MRFNDSTLMTGFIKELLHNFNLPMVSVYTDTTIPYTNKVYIKDDYIVRYTGSDFEKITTYAYNLPILNLTKNLIINSSIYDSYTHKYLGDYLRFLRDYKKLDLMGMYNCFTNEKLSRTHYKLKIARSSNASLDDPNNVTTFTINTDDTYKYYSIPVKFDQSYTIAVECESKFEVACILYNDISLSSIQDILVGESYATIDGSKFNNPFIYSTNFNCAKDIWMKEKDLRLILKMPSNFNSSITVLEGNFLPSSNIVDGSFITTLKEDDTKGSNIYYSKNSLLYINDGEVRPFADRLVEYLLGNAITNLDYISENIRRIQDEVYLGNKFKGYYGIWDQNLKRKIYDNFFNKDITKGSNRYSNKINTTSTINKSLAEVDLLGYILYAPNFVDENGELIKYLSSRETYTLTGDDVLYVYTISSIENTDYIVDSEGKIIGEKCEPLTDYTIRIYKSDEDTNISINVVGVEYDSEGHPILDSEGKDIVYLYNSYKRGGSTDPKEDDITYIENNITINALSSSKNRQLKRFIDSYYDLYGYVDKDVENLLRLS